MNTRHTAVWIWKTPVILFMFLFTPFAYAGGVGTLYYDGNSDGIGDIKQANVCSIVSAGGKNNITLETEDGITIDSVLVRDRPETVSNEFTMTGEPVEVYISGLENGQTILLRFYMPDSFIVDSYFAGISGKISETIEWMDLAKTGGISTEIQDQIVSLQLTDGGFGDLDNQKNGRVVFLSAPGQSSTPGTGGKLTSENVYCFPNPFNPGIHEQSNIRYSIARSGKVNIRIYDAGNRLVKRLLVNADQNAETEYKIPWDGKNGAQQVVTNGLYFFVIETSQGERAVGKIAVLQ